MIDAVAKKVDIKRVPETNGRVVQIFLGCDMRCGIEGLAKAALDHKLNCLKLLPGQFVVFINTKKTILKLITGNRVIAGLKLTNGQKIELETVALIPKSFMASGNIDYDKALRDVLIKKVGKEIE